MKGLRRWTIRILCGAVVLGGGLLASGFAYERIGELRDAQKGGSASTSVNGEDDNPDIHTQGQFLNPKAVG